MTLDGLDAIADHLFRMTGVRRSTRTVQRWIALDCDPLPAYTTPGGRALMCESEELIAWWARVTEVRKRVAVR